MAMHGFFDKMVGWLSLFFWWKPTLLSSRLWRLHGRGINGKTLIC